jgi:hypothetical protein
MTETSGQLTSIYENWRQLTTKNDERCFMTNVNWRQMTSFDVIWRQFDENWRTSNDVNDVNWRQMTRIDVNWRQNFWRVSDDALWRWWRFLTFCDVLWRFLTISIFKKIWKKIFDDFWRFYDVLWRWRQFWSRQLTSFDVNWRQISSKPVFDVNWRHLTSENCRQRQKSSFILIL